MARASSISIRRTSIRARARRCRRSSCGRIAGYQDIFIRGNFGTSNYNALQMQINRRYIRGVQFGASYTWGRALGIGDDDPARVSLARPMREWNYAVAAFNQDHNLVINYTWDIPGGSKFWSNAFTRGLLDGWQLSGVNAFVTGEWAGVTLATTDGFDFTGGDGGTGGSLGGPNPLGGTFVNDGLRVVRPDIVGVVAAAARPARSAHGLVQHGGVRAAVGPRRLRRRAASHDSASGHQQLGSVAVQELHVRRQPEPPVPARRPTTC